MPAARGAASRPRPCSAEYRELNRAVRAAIRRDVRTDIEHRIAEQGPCSVYRNVSRYIGKKNAARTMPTASADDLNEYFVGVGPRVAREIAEQTTETIQSDAACRLPRVGSCAFTVCTIDYDALERAVMSMRNTSSCGADGICVRAIKLCFHAIGVPLLNIINTCLANNDYPSAWKHSLVVPIHKSGPASDPANFRPISLVPVIAKIVERIVQRQLHVYLSQNHLFSSAQHGFRPRHSTETALISVSDKILSAVDKGEISLLCLLDLSKCFDVINHSKLLDKLQLHGVDAEWFRAYLSGHTQSVSVVDPVSGRRTQSRPLPNDIGVFQGSALGPLLYSLFANDLSSFATDAFVIQYADDTQVLVSGRKNDVGALIDSMECTLRSLDIWFADNALKVNAAKTQLMVFGSRQNLRTLPPISVVFRGETLSPEVKVRNLGVIFDPVLTWDAHVAHVVSKCFGILIGLSHIRHHLPQGVISTIVHGLVLSHVRYCISVFGNCTDKNHKQLQKIINFSARVVAGRKKFDHISDVLKGPNWLSSRQLTHYHSLTLLRKVLRWGEPLTLAEELHLSSSSRSRSTRQDGLLHLPRIRSEAGRRRFVYRVPQLFNSLPSNFADQSINSFKRSLKLYLKSEGIN